MTSLETTRINPHGEFPEPLPVMQAVAAVAKADGYAQNDSDSADMERQFPQLKGRFLIDRDGIVRWANVECATEGLAGLGKFPSDEEILAAAQHPAALIGASTSPRLSVRARCRSGETPLLPRTTTAATYRSVWVGGTPLLWRIMGRTTRKGAPSCRSHCRSP
jgi:hypothetical protein